MFKNMLKRSRLSVMRKPGRSIVMILIFFAMSNLILATIIIKSAVGEQMDFAKESLGGTVTLSADMQALRGAPEDGASGSASSDTTKPAFGDGNFERPSATKDLADSIAESEYVKDYTYNISTTANSDDIEAIETNTGFGGAMPGGDRFGGKGGMEQSIQGDFTIYGVNAYAFIDQVESGTMTIASGEYFDEDDINKVMISQDLADENEIAVGDEITLRNVYADDDDDDTEPVKESITVTVMGIYDVSDNVFNANTIYMNVDTAAQLIETDDYNDGDYDVTGVTYSLADAENADAFIAWIDETFPEVAENNLKAAVDTSQYDQMVGPIESVGSFATTILVVVIIAAVVIIALIVTLDVRERKYEMGVLLSLGSKKINIVGQFFLELFMVGTVAFAGACVTATALAQGMGNGILESQIASQQTQRENNFGRPTGGGGFNKGSANSGVGATADAAPEMSEGGEPGVSATMSVRESEAISEIDINAKPVDFLLLFVSGYLVILAALIVPTVNIMRYQPKQILQGKE